MMTRLTLVFTFVFALGFVATAGADLIAQWSGDGTANDSVAGRNGTLQAGAGFDSGALGQAFRLDGVSAFVSVPDDDVWTFASDFTIALFANFDVVNSSNIFIGHDAGGGEQNKWIFFHDASGLSFHINSPSIPPGMLFLNSPTTFSPTLGRFEHFAVTRSGSTYTFFANGVSLGTVNSSQGIPNANAQLTIGQAEGVGFFDGRLDEILIYDEALSASEIAQLSSLGREVPAGSNWTRLALGALMMASGVRALRFVASRPSSEC